MPVKSVAGRAALNIAVSLSLLIVGIGGGAALGLMKGPASAAAAVAAPSTITTFNPADQFVAAGLAVSEPPPAPTVKKTVRRVVTQAASKTGGTAAAGSSLSVNVPGINGVSGSQGNCGATLDDRKINWLLNLVAKAREANPDQAAIADRVAGQLRSALGKNMCAEEAQIHIEGMCADKGTKEFMALMVKELPFFVRPLVGDPCKHDLVAAADKWLPSS